jgi:hypothetical protein
MKRDFMERRICLAGGLFGWFLVSMGGLGAQGMVFPRPELASESVGMLDSEVGGAWYRGSGVVARDPRLIYSCAHVFYDRGRWATDYVFHRAYHARNEPRLNAGASPRGLHYFSSYVDASMRRGSESNLAFASDFTVLYGNQAFGPAVPWLENAGPALRSLRQKRIVGYPSFIDFTRSRGFAFQHATPWFGIRGERVVDGFHDFYGVSTGPGNSGGPIFVRDAGGGPDRLAGILVSGSRRTAGVVALDSSTHTLSGLALGLKEKLRVFASGRSFSVPDGGRNFTVSPIEVSGFSGTISTMEFSMSVTTSRRSDLEVYLRSPGGKIHWVSRRSGGSAANLEIRRADLSRSFSGRPANGVWQVWIRDAVPGNPATFHRASLRIRAF